MPADVYLQSSLLDDFDVKVGQGMRAVRLKQPRARRTLANTAARIHCTHQQLYKYETGQDSISLHRMMMFCMEMNVTPGKLLGFLGVAAMVPIPLHVVSEIEMREAVCAAFAAQRETLKLTKSAVAERIGVCLRQYRHYESGSHRIRPQTYFKIASVLQMTPFQAALLAVTAAQRPLGVRP